jgi:hypothetical protein
MNNLIRYCNRKNDEKLINYKQLKTEGNNPSITKAMRFSNIVKHNKWTTQIRTNNNVNVGY